MSITMSTIKIKGLTIEVQVDAERCGGNMYQQGRWRIAGVDTRWHKIDEVFFDKGAKSRIIQEAKRQAIMELNVNGQKTCVRQR